MMISSKKLNKHMAKVHSSERGPDSNNFAATSAGVKSEIAELPTITKKQVASNSRVSEETNTKVNEIYQAVATANDSEKNQLARCPYCTAHVKTTRLRKHLAKVHPSKHLLNTGARDLPTAATSQRRTERPEHTAKASLSWREDQVQALEALRQSFDEPRDGSKGLGHMRREGDGKFGSFPLHDDYGDEADAQ
jgi:hypothetical protein